MPIVNPSDLLQTFRDPITSIFQSAAAAADARFRGAANPSVAAPAQVDHAAPIVQATTRAALATDTQSPDQTVAAQGLASTFDVCARTYLALARAEASGDQAAIAAATQKLPEFGVCDPRWKEVLTEFLLHYTLVKHGDVPYQRWRELEDFVLPMPDNTKIAIIGDWGTGAPRAQALALAIAQTRPDIVVHLGDIYYSCDAREADAFWRNITAAFPAPTRIFTLCGNHDMYGGGTPYYALLDRLGQPASFFCLRNTNFQILAMDTGYNDFDPLKVNTTVTWVQDGADADGRPSNDNYSELTWHNDKFATAAGRRTILLSHHPLFTLNAPIDGHAVNPRLHQQTQSWLPDVALWLWGHEHNQVIYAGFNGLARGRCVGASAIPVPAETPLYARSPDLPATEIAPGLLPGKGLGIDAATGLYDLGYALVTFAGQAASVSYYGFNQSDGTKLLHQEPL
jgi:predicted MPP superfamily phosphohydrolase